MEDSSTESSALITERQPGKLFLEASRFGIVRGIGEAVRELIKRPLLILTLLQAALDQLHDHAVGAGSLASRQGLHTPGDGRREGDALSNSLFCVSHGAMLHHYAPM